MKQIASPGSMHEIGCSGLVHWDDPEGWDGEGVGRGFRMGNTCTPIADSCQCMSKQLQYCKVISLQLKLKNKSNSGFPSDSVVKTLPANTGDLGSIPGSGRSPGEETGNPL